MSDLLWWAKTELKPKAEEAYTGNGKQAPGEWCQFCKVKAQCKALANTALSIAREKANPNLISPEEMATEVLPYIEVIKSWLKGIEDFTLQAALDGTNYPGYKLVAGRSIRKITNPDAVIALLTKEGYAPETILKPTELRTITDLEKLIGKKAFGTLCKDYIEKPQGKPTLVPDSDKREAYNSAADDFKDIG